MIKFKINFDGGRFENCYFDALLPAVPRYGEYLMFKEMQYKKFYMQNFSKKKTYESEILDKLRDLMRDGAYVTHVAYAFDGEYVYLSVSSSVPVFNNQNEEYNKQ